jgi:hypothetical protein
MNEPQREPTLLESNHDALVIIRRIIDQHQAIVDMNVKLVDLLGYPLVIVKSVAVSPFEVKGIS